MPGRRYSRYAVRLAEQAALQAAEDRELLFNRLGYVEDTLAEIAQHPDTAILALFLAELRQVRIEAHEDYMRLEGTLAKLLEVWANATGEVSTMAHRFREDLRR